MDPSNFSIKNAMQEASEIFAEVATTAAPLQNQHSVAGRSVLDFDHPHDLKLALEERMVSPGYACAEPTNGISDWLLPVPDPDAEPQTVLTEMQRLLTLKSYLLLDAAKEEAFDKLTKEACEVYNVPTSVISIVDLGRQFFLSNTDTETDVRETPRTAAFCSHTILSKQGICVVPDTIQDPRFRNNCLVTGGPKLRFYAGAPLISPEGFKLGTFCVEGPDPRPEGLTHEEQVKLKEFAAKAMKLMVDRRSVMQRVHSAANLPQNVHIRRHAAVTTNLGALIYQHYFDESVTAMKCFQESVQTLMHLEEDPSISMSAASSTTSDPSQSTSDTPLFLNKERQEELYTLLECMKAAESREQMDDVLERVHVHLPITDSSNDILVPQIHVDHIPRMNSVPGIFILSSVLQGAPSQVRIQSLTFNEAFEVSLLVAEAFDPSKPNQSKQLDDISFIIPLNQCSKATLFNMGLVHYQWGSADIAMQYFDLAASLSQTNDPTHFDPVILGCLNNMAQVNLQYGRSTEAMELLSDALTRGNAALTNIYEDGSDDISCSSIDSSPPVNESKIESMEERNANDRRRTLRLRRKLARTLLNIGHVHFYKCEYDATMKTLNDAINLLHTDMEVIEVASIWYNMALVQYFKGEKTQALNNVDKFLELTKKVLCNNTNHIQIADALHRKGKILFELGNSTESMTHLNDALRLRRELLGETDPAVAESMCMIGKVLLHRNEYDMALEAFRMVLAIQRETLATKSINGTDAQLLSFEVAQTLLEIGRVFHAKNDLQQALTAYIEVGELTRKFFGERHTFVAQVDTIVGNLYLNLGDVEKSKHYLDEANAIKGDDGKTIEPVK
jgi:tetratricopeptide (TPR) repeat protein